MSGENNLAVKMFNCSFQQKNKNNSVLYLCSLTGRLSRKSAGGRGNTEAASHKGHQPEKYKLMTYIKNYIMEFYVIDGSKPLRNSVWVKNLDNNKKTAKKR